MIAKTASCAIWRPKLAETFFVPILTAPTFRCRSCVSRVCSPLVSDFVRIWNDL